MNLPKVALVSMIAVTMLSACHSSKKMTYIQKFHKDARNEVRPAKAKLASDTVRVVYPELAMFDFNKDEVKPDAKESLQRFAALLSRYDRINFIINGYTDTVGTMDVNQSLSQRRAENAKTIFTSNGVNAGRIQTNGMGSSNPIMTNMTDDGRQANRRVELLLFEKK